MPTDRPGEDVVRRIPEGVRISLGLDDDEPYKVLNDKVEEIADTLHKPEVVQVGLNAEMVGGAKLVDLGALAAENGWRTFNSFLSGYFKILNTANGSALSITADNLTADRDLQAPNLDGTAGAFPSLPVTDNMPVRTDGTAGGLAAEAINLTAAAANVTGTLPVANGGTGRNTIPAGGYVYGADTSAVGNITGTDQVAGWNGSSPSAISAGTGITISAGVISSSGGTIGGSSGATDNRIIRADGTGGSTIQSSGASIDDSGNITGNNLSGTNTGDQTITLTGDVTGSGTGTFAATIANDAVTLAKIADQANNTILGNNTGGAASPVALTAAQTKTLLAIANTDVSGLGTMSTQAASSVSISGGSITGITDLAVADGGTGASTASGARTNLEASYRGRADVTTSTTFSVTPTHDRYLLVANASGGAVDFSLDDITTFATGTLIWISAKDVTMGVTINPDSGQKINGVTDGTVTIAAAYTTVAVWKNDVDGEWHASTMAAAVAV